MQEDDKKSNFIIKFDKTKIKRIIDGFCSCKGDCQECWCKTAQNFCGEECQCDKSKCKNLIKDLNTINTQQPLKVEQLNKNKESK